jgi:K+-sensing histidine kinase KdpD
MIRTIDTWLRSKSRAGIMTMSIVALSIIGAVDYFTGVEVNLTLFYLFPVILVTWGIGTGAGAFASLFAALVWATIDHFGRPSLDLATASWNICIELALFLFFAVVAARLRDDAREQERLNGELQSALAEVRTLSGILPICAWCKKIRDENGNWQRLESYIKSHSDAEFTHGICPECAQERLSSTTSPKL